MNSDEHSLADFLEGGHDDLFAKVGPWFEFIQDFARKGYLSYRRILSTAPDRTVRIHDPARSEERELLMFGGSNYLGLATHPRVLEAAVDATRRFGTGSGGSALLCGTSKVLRELEERLAAFEGCEDAVLFPTGYAANTGAISALVRRGDHVVFDRLAHASIIDGCRLSEGRAISFRHSDARHLDRALGRLGRGGKLVVVDGVYSMDGDLAPLPELQRVARRHGARLLVDEAHATGVLGPAGAGTIDHFGLKGTVDLVVGTLSKALGSEGGFVASSREVVNYVRYLARSHFFSTAPPAPQMAAALAALELVEEEPWRRRQLHRNAVHLQRRLVEAGFRCPAGDPRSAIIPVLIGDELATRKMGKRVHELGLFVNPVPYPAVPKGQARLRLSVMATHTQADLDRAVDILGTAGREVGVIA